MTDSINNSLQVLNCDGCGACCDSVGIIPFASDELARLTVADRDRLHQVGWGPRSGGARRVELGLPCPAYDARNRRCAIHDIRPRVCREYEIGGADCLEDRERSPNVAREAG